MAFLALAVVLAACMGDGAGPGAGSGAGSGASNTTPAPSGPDESLGNPDILRIGDILTIRVSGIPTPDISEEKIDDAGYISMPLIGKFKAVGLTTAQLKGKIEQAYIEQKIYATPSVTIIPEVRYVNVNGEVRAPSRITYTNDLTALGALSACGGFTDYAEKRSIRISRGNQVIMFDAVEASRNPSSDLKLQAGDQIQVARTIF